MTDCRFAFCASTGRTATMFVAATLNALEGVSALHEGQTVGQSPQAKLPLINLQNRQAWQDPGFALETVNSMRDAPTLLAAAEGSGMLVDVAFYNSPLLDALNIAHPDAPLLVIHRRCADFIRSATILRGEDTLPVGWPDPDKPLTDREQFIAMGRLGPGREDPDYDNWQSWSAIQRNIWLWHRVNSHLAEFAATHANCTALRYEELAGEPATFWRRVLETLDLDSPANRAICLERSRRKINQRSDYQVGAPDTWSKAEQALYESLALPLEEQLYD